MKNKRMIIILFVIVFFLFSVSMLFPESDIYDRIGIIAEHGLHGAVPEENIDLFTGNLTLRFKDIVLPGPNGFDLVIWRVYNSKILKDRIPYSAWGIQQEPYSWVGLGWSLHMGRVHNFNSNEPVIEFPDGRWETAYPDKNGSNYITRGFLKYNKSTYKLYFKDGTVWTFGEQKTLTYVGYTEQVRVVTKITNSYGHTINVEYESSSPNIMKITDSMGRTVNFTTNTSTNPKLNKITVRNATGGYCYYYYTVDAYSSWGGYYRLKKFDPPELPASTYEYYSGSDKYEIKTVNTSYGGKMSYEYDNHTFYFQVQPLYTRVVTKKSINSSNWFYTYPSYYNASTGTVNINGPVYNTSVIYNAYSSQSPWKIGLIKDKLFSDSSYSESYVWEPQVISNTRWYVLTVDMGPATAALLSQVSKNIKGDSDLSETYLYERTSPKNYGLPTKIKYYANGNLKNYKRIYYYYENNSTFASKYMLNYIKENKIYNSSNVKLKETLTDYYTTSGKCGAIDRIRRWNGSSYLTWDYTYYSSNPNNINVTINLPGSGGTETYKYSYGILSKFDRPGFTELSRTISSYNSAIKTETNRYGGTMSFDYDSLNRIKKINMPSGFNDINVYWYTNSVSITQAGNTVVKYWDSMGRDLGYRESGDGITLYYRKTLDSEGRVVSESKGSTSSSDKYYYQLTAAGQVKKITDPREKVTTISYSGDQRTVTDPNDNQTKFEYNHLPGLFTKLTDAKNKVATYTYDGIGRLKQVKYNNSRTQNYYYNSLDQITSESHPETGNISYSYNSAGNLYKKSWSGTTLTYTYNSSNQLTKLDSGDEIINYYYSYGNLSSISSNNGWTRDQISYNSLGSVIKERQTISGLSGYKTLIYTHSGNNNLKSITYPDGRIVNYTNNGLNMPETVKFNNKSLVSQIAYSIHKQPNSMTISGNGTIFSASYNSMGFLSSTSFKKGGTTHYRANYGYDNVGNITSIYNTVPGLNSSFSYDSLYRIQSATYSGASNFSYTFDTYGNMLTVKKDNITVLNRSYTSKNQVNGFGYDTHGNLTSAVGFSYNWDNQNRLTTARMNSEVIANNTYNERSLRLKASRILPPSITITSPNGGENWGYGTIQNITWTSTGIVGNVNIEYSTDNGSNYQ
jgi:YD repeat-containing protein